MVTKMPNRGVTTEEELQHLRDLVAVARDGELGYNTAASHVQDTRLTTVFSEYAKERANFVKGLEQEIVRLGGEKPAENGSVSGSLFRGWMSVKSVATGGSPEAIVAACETGEDAAAAAFERVVNSDISGQTRDLIEGQWNKIKQAHQRMVNLKAELG